MWYLLSAAALLGDRVTKKKARENSLPSQALNGTIRFCHIENAGFAGGKGVNHPGAAKCIHALAYGISLPALLLLCRKGFAAKCGISLLAAGGGSNLYDRLRRGTVTDMLQFPKAPGKLKRLVFNAADFMIFLGALLTLPAVFRKH